MVPHERPRIAGVTRSRKSRGKEPEKTLSVFIGREDVSPLNATSNDVEEERCGRETGFAGHFVNIYLALRPPILRQGVFRWNLSSLRGNRKAPKTAFFNEFRGFLYYAQRDSNPQPSGSKPHDNSTKSRFLLQSEGFSTDIRNRRYHNTITLTTEPHQFERLLRITMVVRPQHVRFPIRHGHDHLLGRSGVDHCSS